MSNVSLQSEIVAKLNESNAVSPDVVAEFIIMMLTNQKTFAQIESELAEFEIPQVFIVWLKQRTQPQDEMVVDDKPSPIVSIRDSLRKTLVDSSSGSRTIKKKLVVDQERRVHRSPIRVPPKTDTSNEEAFPRSSSQTHSVFSRLGKKTERNHHPYRDTNPSIRGSALRSSPTYSSSNVEFTTGLDPMVGMVKPDKVHAPRVVECKFGLKCTRPECTFSHPSPALQPIIKPAFNPLSAKLEIQCKFYPNCMNAKCPFTHPPKKIFTNKSIGSGIENVACKFAPWCRKEGCPFLHTYKGTGLTSQRVFALDEADISGELHMLIHSDGMAGGEDVSDALMMDVDTHVLDKNSATRHAEKKGSDIHIRNK